MGASILGAVGLDALVADTPERFVAIARDLALDRARCLALRRDLRPRLVAMDDVRYTQQREGRYRQAWRRCGAATC